MIDLHCHILPGLDDGAGDFDTSLAIARVAAADGVRVIAATPHIREDHPFDPLEVVDRTAELNDVLRRSGVELEVVPGGEVAISKSAELDDETLHALCLGGTGTGYLLVESPYTVATDLLEQALFNLQLRGFRVVLAHPERSPSFISGASRLRTLVERGILCSVTAASLEGNFGRTVRRAALTLVRRGLAHDLASDAHDPRRRGPTLSGAVDVVERERPGLGRWLTEGAPSAMLAGEALPAAPGERAGRLSSLLGRRRM